MIDHATITFSNDPDGQFIFPIFSEHNFPKYFRNENVISKKSVLLPSKDVEKKRLLTSQADRNRLKLGQHLDIGRKLFNENPCHDLSKSQKLQQARPEPFTKTKRVTNTVYQFQDDKDPTILKTVN